MQLFPGVKEVFSSSHDVREDDSSRPGNNCMCTAGLKATQTQEAGNIKNIHTKAPEAGLIILQFVPYAFVHLYLV